MLIYFKLLQRSCTCKQYQDFSLNWFWTTKKASFFLVILIFVLWLGVLVSVIFGLKNEPDLLLFYPLKYLPVRPSLYFFAMLNHLLACVCLVTGLTRNTLALKKILFPWTWEINVSVLGQVLWWRADTNSFLI